MARKSRESIQRRLREQRRAEKAALKRQKREQRRQESNELAGSPQDEETGPDSVLPDED